ncbi:hypothetical protein S101520_02740 [Lactiplantibacillus plantarum subsp. plantarum]|nr:hypothetical protein S101520_02740 [Lactiplantibacillus plantarum subsp. plantarum]
MQMQLSVVLLERLSSRIINSYTYRLLHSLSYSLSSVFLKSYLEFNSFANWVLFFELHLPISR